jgi:CRISPR/Cas system-associated exonuclease Cas4 (RecB family)
MPAMDYAGLRRGRRGWTYGKPPVSGPDAFELIAANYATHLPADVQRE